MFVHAGHADIRVPERGLDRPVLPGADHELAGPVDVVTQPGTVGAEHRPLFPGDPREEVGVDVDLHAR